MQRRSRSILISSIALLERDRLFNSAPTTECGISPQHSSENIASNHCVRTQAAWLLSRRRVVAVGNRGQIWPNHWTLRYTNGPSIVSIRTILYTWRPTTMFLSHSGYIASHDVAVPLPSSGERYGAEPAIPAPYRFFRNISNGSDRLSRKGNTRFVGASPSGMP